MKIIAMLAALISLSECHASIISVNGPPTNPSIGNTFIVEIRAMGLSDLYAFQFDVAFNPALLAAISVTEGALLPSGGTTFFIPGTIDNMGGTITVNADTLIGAIPGVAGDGLLTAIRFTALASGTSTVFLQNSILLDSTLSEVTSSAVVQNGLVTTTGSSLPEPSTFSMVACVAGASFFLGLRRCARP